MSQNIFDGEYIDEIMSALIINISKELIRFNRSDVILKIHEYLIHKLNKKYVFQYQKILN